MNRETKFRGKIIACKSNPEMIGKWAFGFFIETVNRRAFILEGKDLDLIPSIEALRGEYFDTQYFYEVDIDTVGQLRDHLDDGTEVYDDDIVEFEYGGQKRIEPVIGYNSITYVGRSHNFQLNKLFHDIETRPYSVLGNIHENPELLK